MKITQLRHLGLVLNVCLRFEFKKGIKELQIELMKSKELHAHRKKEIKEIHKLTLRNDGSNKRHIYINSYHYEI